MLKTSMYFYKSLSNYKDLLSFFIMAVAIVKGKGRFYCTLVFHSVLGRGSKTHTTYSYIFCGMLWMTVLSRHTLTTRSGMMNYFGVFCSIWFPVTLCLKILVGVFCFKQWWRPHTSIVSVTICVRVHPLPNQVFTPSSGLLGCFHCCAIQLFPA